LGNPELINLSVVSQKRNKWIPKPSPFFIESVENDHRFPFHEIVSLFEKDQERKKLLHRARTSRKDDKGIRIFELKMRWPFDNIPNTCCPKSVLSNRIGRRKKM
jgi:hypothetical protein